MAIGNRPAQLKSCLATFLVVGGLACGLPGGCPWQVPGPPPTPTIVLTFDDGPLSADIRVSEMVEHGTLLAPLHAILETLRRRQLQGVFYIAGPGNTADAEHLMDAYRDGLTAISSDGHVLGYHAFDHAARIWANPQLLPQAAEARMAVDLDELAQFIETVLAPAGRSREQIFSPIFRQPFGGEGLFEPEGRIVAARRGWVYHGYRIDSMDWTVNVDVDPSLVAHLPVGTEAEHVAFVRASLRDGVRHWSRRPVIDVLFHVNGFTARHLDEWIDTLGTAVQEQTGNMPAFTVPGSYLTTSDPWLDLSVVGDLLVGS